MSLVVERVSHSWRVGEPVLSDASFDVERGESVAIVGPSGSGKSTLLALAGLLIRPESGSVRIDGQPAPPDERLRRRLRRATFAWIFQSVNALPGRTVLDNVAIGSLSRGARRCDAEAQGRNALAKVGLAHLDQRPLATLSGGERQRMCVARVLAATPKVVLADEPTGQLDRASSELVVDALEHLTRAGTGLVVATHDPSVARRCDRVLSIVDGHLVEAPR